VQGSAIDVQHAIVHRDDICGMWFKPQLKRIPVKITEMSLCCRLKNRKSNPARSCDSISATLRMVKLCSSA
jgi:hypothetical protein